MPLYAVTAMLLRRAGFSPVYPDDCDALCCGMPFESKGAFQQADAKWLQTEQALLAASRGGIDPVLLDTSPCSFRLREHSNADRLTLLHEHRATGLLTGDGIVTGCVGVCQGGCDDACGVLGGSFTVHAERTIVATGGINGSVEQVRRHWLHDWPGPPRTILNGAHPNADGAIHQSAAGLGARLDHLGDMWNYAAGVPHPQPHFEGHGLSLIPPKTCLWLDPDGEPVGPDPMVTGFDTNGLCRQVAAHAKRPFALENAGGIVADDQAHNEPDNREYN